MTPGDYLAALAVTLVVEPPLYALALRRLGENGGRAYLAGLAVNASSHPLAWFVVFPLADRRWSDLVTLLVVEGFAVGWESGALALWRRRDVAVLVMVALVTNGISLGLGALV